MFRQQIRKIDHNSNIPLDYVNSYQTSPLLMMTTNTYTRTLTYHVVP